MPTMSWDEFYRAIPPPNWGELADDIECELAHDIYLIDDEAELKRAAAENRARKKRLLLEERRRRYYRRYKKQI